MEIARETEFMPFFVNSAFILTNEHDTVIMRLVLRVTGVFLLTKTV